MSKNSHNRVNRCHSTRRPHHSARMVRDSSRMVAHSRRMVGPFLRIVGQLWRIPGRLCGNGRSIRRTGATTLRDSPATPPESWDESGGSRGDSPGSLVELCRPRGQLARIARRVLRIGGEKWRTARSLRRGRRSRVWRECLRKRSRAREIHPRQKFVQRFFSRGGAKEGERPVPLKDVSCP